jgi:hypothetical protein
MLVSGGEALGFLAELRPAHSFLLRQFGSTRFRVRVPPGRWATPIELVLRCNPIVAMLLYLLCCVLYVYVVILEEVASVLYDVVQDRSSKNPYTGTAVSEDNLIVVLNSRIHLVNRGDSFRKKMLIHSFRTVDLRSGASSARDVQW